MFDFMGIIIPSARLDKIPPVPLADGRRLRKMVQLNVAAKRDPSVNALAASAELKKAFDYCGLLRVEWNELFLSPNFFRSFTKPPDEICRKTGGIRYT